MMIMKHKYNISNYLKIINPLASSDNNKFL